MDRTPTERAVSFRPTLVNPPSSNAEGSMLMNSINFNTNNNNLSASRLSSAVAPGYAQLSPTTGGLRVRRVASHRRLQGSPGPGSGKRSESNFDTITGTSPQLGSLLHRRGEDPLVALVHQHHHSMDSMMDATSTASPVNQSPVGAYPNGTFPTTLSRDSATMQEFFAMQQQQQHHNQQKGVTVIYPLGASPLDPHMRMPEYASMQEDAQSNGDDSANEDRVQVRVEGYYEGGNVNVLIPNDLPPSTLLYVLTASDGRDLMFKLTQYTLQLAICFLKMPSLFSPEVQVFTGPWAERLYRNYNTIRHGRSLFKMGRGLLNLFTVQTVCERMWMRYENRISRSTCAVLLPVVTRVEKLLLMLGVSPVWGRAMSRQLLHWSQAAELTPGQRRLEESQDSMSMDWRIQERMKAKKHPSHPGVLLADDTFTHIAEVERSGNGGGGGGSGGGILRSMMHSTLTDTAIHTAMNAMGFSVPRGEGARYLASLLPSQPVLPHNPADDEQSTPEHSTRVSPHGPVDSLPARTGSQSIDTNATFIAASVSANESVNHDEGAVTLSDTAAQPAAAAGTASTPAADVAAPGVSTEATNSTATRSSSPHSSLKRAETSTSSSADDGLGRHSAHHLHNGQTPPFVQGTLPEVLDNELMPGITPSKLTAATQPTLNSYDGEGEEGGRVTLLRPLPRPTQHSSTTDPECSITGDDNFGLRLDSTIHEDARSTSTVATANAPREPMSMPDNWRPATAPTVPPSQADDFGYGPTLCFADHPSSPSPPPYGASATLRSAAAPAKKALVSGPDTGTGAAASTREASPVKSRAATADAPRGAHKKNCPPFEVVPVLPAPVKPTIVLPESASSSLSALAKQQQSGNAEANESEMSILSSEANSSFHVRPSGASGAMTTWLNELQPASAALPARVRKGILQFNPMLMTLLGIRSLAAALRRFLRDASLISSERFVNFSFVEVRRRAILRFINRCWLVISVIDLLLNTVRLLQPGWVKYATARQNIRCRCGCQGDQDPADTVWRTHGFIARRKTDLFFPPLNLDYGAPFVSYVSYMEAADPARLIPACSRCGCLYKELPSEAADFESATEEAGPMGTVSLAAAGGAFMHRSSPAAHASLPSETPYVVSMTRSSQPVSEEGDRSLSLGAAEREKPRWVQMYEAEVQEAGESRRRAAAAAAAATNTTNGATPGSSGRLGARRETQKPSSATQGNDAVEESTAPPMPELVDLALPPAQMSGAGRPLKPQHSHDTTELAVGSPVEAPPQESKTGILFVPWMMRKFFDYVWLLRVHPNLTATLLLEVRYLAEFYLSYKYCFGGYETFKGDAPLSAILHPYGAVAGFVSAAVGLLRVIESAPTS